MKVLKTLKPPKYVTITHASGVIERRIIPVDPLPVEQRHVAFINQIRSPVRNIEYQYHVHITKRGGNLNKDRRMILKHSS